MAARLLECVRAEDTVGRLGGDEFAIILSGLVKAEDCGVVAKKITDIIAGAFQLDEHEVFITASIGIAIYPDDGDNVEVLIRNADKAMFQAKNLGKNTYHFYTAEMNERALERMQMNSALQHAIERDEFQLYFQPRASLASGKLTGFEALLRWQRLGTGLIMPANFIPLLEDSGLILPVGEWVIGTACRQVRSWMDAGITPMPVAVNLSAKQFRHQDIFAVIDKALCEHNVDASLLEVEITESAAMHNPDETIVTLRKLHTHRVHISIDDFGTGYSSLSYLKRFPIDALKLDRSFVEGLPDDADDASITRAVITMAHSLNLTVTAEGVETEAQRVFLASNGCDELQGYYYSRPLTASGCTDFLRRKTGLPVIDRVRMQQSAEDAILDSI